MNLYSNVLHGDIEATEEARHHCHDYINLLLEEATFFVEKVLTEAKRLQYIFDKDEFLLEVLAKLYLEQIIGTKSFYL